MIIRTHYRLCKRENINIHTKCNVNNMKDAYILVFFYTKNKGTHIFILSILINRKVFMTLLQVFLPQSTNRSKKIFKCELSS